jgi:hypothetical protein
MKPNDDFLQKYLADVRDEMKWRRELEFRLLQFLLVFYPIIGTAMVTLYQTSISPTIYMVLSIGASLFILPATLFVTNRITLEHKAYAGLAKTVIKIWKYFGLFESGTYIKDETIIDPSLQNPKTGFGQGKGYLRTLYLIWTVTAAMIVVILTLGILKLL